VSALPLALALRLAAAYAPAVAPETWLSVVHCESRLDPLAIGDNTTHRTHHPATLAEAVALASGLAAAGHSLDLGAAQIDTAAGHLQRRGLPLAAAFDPRTAFRVGDEVLTDCYRRATGTDEQARLRAALGCYNGDRSGAYARCVLASAERIVPAIRLAGDAAGTQGVEPGAVAPPAPPPACAPSWDPWAQLACARRSHRAKTAPVPHAVGGANPRDGEPNPDPARGGAGSGASHTPGGT
jgi:type IV secretion system protein VirB1